MIDDAPREDFSPRNRHTLKEFAVRCSILVIDFDFLIWVIMFVVDVDVLILF